MRRKTDEANNTGLQTKRVGRGEKVRFTYNMPTATDQEIIVYAGHYLKSLGDVSNLQPTSMLIANADRLTEIECHSPNLINTDLSECTKLQRIDLSDCTALGTGIGAQPILNIQNCKYLRYVNCMNTQLTAIYTMQAGGNLEEIYYPETTQVVQLTNQTYLHTVGIPYGYNDLLKNTSYTDGIVYSWDSALDSPTDDSARKENFRRSYEPITIDDSKTYKFYAGINGGAVRIVEFDKNKNNILGQTLTMLSAGVYSSIYTPTSSTKYVLISIYGNGFNENRAKQFRFCEINEYDTFRYCKNLANVQISNCNAIKYLQYPFRPNDPINFDSLKYVQNLNITNSLSGLNSMQFNGFDKLRNVTLSSLKELNTIGFEDMMPVTTTSTLKTITISDCPLITSLSFNVSSDDYKVAFASNGKLDLGGLQSLKSIKCNTSVKGLDTLIIPTSLTDLRFTTEYGDGINEIKNIWSASAVHNNDGFEGIDFQDMTIEFIDMLGLNGISNAINFHIAPKTQNPNLNTARDGSVSKPWFHPIGSIDLSNYTGLMIGMLRGVDLNKLDVVINTDRDQVDLTSLFECATLPTAQNIVTKTNNILAKFPKSVIWDYMFKGCDLSFSPNDIRIPNRGLSLKGMYKDSNVTEDVSLPNVTMAVDEMFMNCTGITTYEKNWLKTYSKLTYTVPTSNGTSGSWDDSGNYTEGTNYNQFLYTPSDGEKAFKIMTTGTGTVRINYFYNASFISRIVYTPEFDSYPYVVTIPDGCNKVIFVCDKTIGFASEGTMTTSNCYTNTGGALSEIPVSWGGYGLDKNVTSIYVIDTTHLTNTTTFNLVLNDSQAGITDWGDGITNSEKSHTYAEHGTYTVKTKSWSNGTPSDDLKTALIEVKQIKLIGHNGNSKDYSNAFNGCSKLTKVTAYNLTPTNCNGMFSGCSSLIELVGLDTWDMSNCNSIQGMFYEAGIIDPTPVYNMLSTFKGSSADSLFRGSKIESIELGRFPSSIKKFINVAYGCSNLKTIDFTNCAQDTTNWEGAFRYVGRITSMIGLETLNASDGVILGTMFFSTDLSNVGTIDMSGMTCKINAAPLFSGTKVTTIKMGFDWSNITGNLPNYMFADFNSLENMEWGRNLKANFTTGYTNLDRHNNLTVQSLLNLFDALYDFSEEGGTHTVIIGATNIAKLTREQMLIAIKKHWTIQGAPIQGVFRDTDISTLTSDGTVTAVAIELTADNYLTRIDEVLGVYTNAVDVYFFDDGSVTTLDNMCYENNTTTKDKIQNVTFLDGYFENCTSFKNTFREVKGLVTVTGIPDNVTAINYAFFNIPTLISVSKIPSKCTIFSIAFRGCTNLTAVPINGWTGNLYMTFMECTSLNQQINVVNPTNLNDTFCTCSSLEISPTFTGTYTGSISYLFLSCKKLTNITLPTTWTPSSTENTFNNCTQLVTIENLGALDMSNCTTCTSMFKNCSSLTSIDFIKSWNLSNVSNIGGIFNGCTSLIGEVTLQLNMPKCMGMSDMFLDCTGLTSLDVTGWNIPLVESINAFVLGCTNLTSLIGTETWNMSSNLRSMNYFISNTKITELNLSNWDFTYTGSPGGALYNYGLTTIILNNVTDNVAERTSSNGLRGLLRSLNNPVEIVMNEFAMTDFSNLFQGVTKIKNDIVFPTNTTNVSNCFKGCTGMTHIHSNWKTEYEENTKSKTPTLIYNNSTNGSYEVVSPSNYIRVQVNRNTSSDNSVYPVIQVNGKDVSLYQYKIVSADDGTLVGGTEYQYSSDYIYIGENNSFTISFSESNISVHIYACPGVMMTTDCYAGCTGVTHCDGVACEGLDELPTAWGGFGFSKATTSILELVIPENNYTLTLNPDMILATIDNGEHSGYDIYNRISWGDGTVTEGEYSHTYTTAGIYTFKGHYYMGAYEPTATLKVCLSKIHQIPRYYKSSFYNHRFLAKDCKNLTEVTINNFVTTPNNNGLLQAFNGCTNLQKVTITADMPLYNIRDTFRNCTSLVEINGMETWDTSTTKEMYGAFYNCSQLPYSVLLQLSNTLNFDSCTNASEMFYNDTFDDAIPLQQLKVSNMTRFDSLLSGVKVKGDLDLSMWNVHPTNLTSFLNNAIINGSVNLSGWDVSSCTSFERMLHWCNTPSVNLSGWDFSGCTDMGDYTFVGCSASDWDFTGASGIKFNIVIDNPQNHSVDSLVGLFNALYDFASNGDTGTHTIEIGSKNLAKLTDEQIAIATNKGWTVS